MPLISQFAKTFDTIKSTLATCLLADWALSAFSLNWLAPIVAEIPPLPWGTGEGQDELPCAHKRPFEMVPRCL